MRALVLVLMVAACGGGGVAMHHDCTDGETRACYRGTPGTEGVGACHAGVETCSGGLWPGVCVGDMPPFYETCNGVDDDCDGEIDNAEDAGAACMIGGCPGVRACTSAGDVSCVALPPNECGRCGGPAVSGLGGDCHNDVCSGTFVCSTDKSSAICSAPLQNECELCGGPAVPNLGDLCTASAGCAGRLACNASGLGSVCDCSANICNDGTTIRNIVPPDVGDLVITEVMPSPAKVSDTVGEWFEVRVMKDVDLNNLALDRAGDAAPPNVIRAYDCMRVTAGTTLVFAKNTMPAMNGGIATNLIYGTFTFSLISGTPVAPGDIQLLWGTTVIDAVTWTNAASGKARQLDPDYVDANANDNLTNFCDATASYGLGDLGTPGLANTQCAALPAVGQCDDAGTLRPIVKPTTGQLVITELMANPAIESPAGQEWFEITNVGAAAFDLNGLGLDRANDSRAPDVVASAACKSLAPGAFAVLARSSASSANAGLATVDATFGLSLINSNGEVQVVDPTTCAATTPFACATVYDSVPYATSTDGVSSQLEPGMFTTTANDMAASFCPAVTTYGDGTNRGTPGAANACN